MGDEKTFTARFKVEDDGSIVLDKISGKLVDVGVRGQESLGKISSSLSIIKLDSLINLGERAFNTGQRIWDMAKQTASAVNDIQRMSEVTGLASDTYQKLTYAAKMNDVEITSLSTGMKILAGRMDDVRKGSTEAVSLFESIGVSTKDAFGRMKSFDQMLGDLADRFKSMSDPVQKVALATDLFGRSGENLIPMLNRGSEGLREFYKEAERLGIVLDEKLLKKGSELEDRFKKAEAWWSSFFKKIVIGAYEAIGALEKYHTITGKLEISMTKGLRKKEEKPEGEGPSESRFIPKETVTYARQSEEAIKAVARALEKVAEQETKLNAFYADDVELLRQANREGDRRSKALDIMKQLGIKTKPGAEREITDIQEKFKSLLGQGFSPEEIGQAKAKIEEQLRAVGEKYKTPSGWQKTGKEGGVQLWSNVSKNEMTRDIEKMVDDSIKELEPMQRQTEEVTKGPTKIKIDTTAFTSANQAADELRKKLDDLNNKVITVTIDQRITGDDRIIEILEEGMVRRFENKQSRFRTIIEKNIEGVTYYSNG